MEDYIDKFNELSEYARVAVALVENSNGKLTRRNLIEKLVVVSKKVNSSSPLTLDKSVEAVNEAVRAGVIYCSKPAKTLGGIDGSGYYCGTGKESDGHYHLNRAFASAKDRLIYGDRDSLTGRIR